MIIFTYNKLTKANMNNLKNYNEFISESNSNNIINDILDSLEVTITDMVSRAEANHNKRSPLPFSDYERKITRLVIISDMVKSVEKYTQPTDKLLTINAKTTNKGNIGINATIQRGSESFRLDTEVIYAGGHNIQVLHYRYITKTNLPKTGNQGIYKELKVKLKKLTKSESLNLEIRQYEERIEKSRETISTNSKLTDADILAELKASGRIVDYTWKNALKIGTAKNFDNDEETFNKFNADSITRAIKLWKVMSIDQYSQNLTHLVKALDKLRGKLDALLNSI